MPSFQIRKELSIWLERAPVQRFIIALIVLNGAILGIQTSAGLTAYWSLAVSFRPINPCGFCPRNRLETDRLGTAVFSKLLESF